jgi:hypothetical protein
MTTRLRPAATLCWGCTDRLIQGNWTKDMTTPNLSNLLVAGRLNDRYRDAASERAVHPRTLPTARAQRRRPGLPVIVRRRLGWLSPST